MSIFAYTGLPGSGKTYSVVKHQILPALQQGRVVCTNVPVKRDLICHTLGVDLQMLREFPLETVQAEPDRIEEFFPAGAVLVLDEVWKIFPAGLKANNVPDAFKSAFAEHRHRVDHNQVSSQIVLVTQDLAQISMFARQLVEQTFQTSKLWQVGWHGKYRVDVFAGGVQGHRSNASSALRQIFGSYEKRIYQFYQSHTRSEAEGSGADEKSVDRRGNVLLRPIFLVAPVLVIGASAWALHSLWTRHHHQVQAAGPGAASAASATGPVGLLSGIANNQAETRPQPAKRWRVSAVYRGQLGAWTDTAVLTNGELEELVALSQCRRARWGYECPAPGGGMVREGYAPPERERQADPHPKAGG